MNNAICLCSYKQFFYLWPILGGKVSEGACHSLSQLSIEQLFELKAVGK